MNNESELDREWKSLILKAKKLGITKDEIRKYFQQIKRVQKQEGKVFR